MGQKSSNELNRRQLGAWAGMIGSVLFVAIFLLEGLLRLDYNPLSMFVSELSLGSRGWIQIFNFVVSGALFLIFAWGAVVADFRKGKSAKAGPMLLAIIGISLIASGPLVMDPTDTPIEQMSMSGILHQLFGALVFLLMPISCFVFWRRFRSDPNWRSLKWWTFFSGVVVTISVILLRIVSVQPPVAPDAFLEWSGLIQRVALVTYFAWIFTFALKLYGRNKS